jgi:hypothetical protein
MRARRLAH